MSLLVVYMQKSDKIFSGEISKEKIVVLMWVKNFLKSVLFNDVLIV